MCIFFLSAPARSTADLWTISRPSFLAILQQKQLLARVYKRYRALANNCLCCSLISPTDVNNSPQLLQKGGGRSPPPSGVPCTPSPPNPWEVGLKSALILFRFHFKLTEIKFFCLLWRFNLFWIYSNIVRFGRYYCF